MNITIRSEKVSDYNQIANINYEAFLAWHPDNQYVSEPILVDLLRHNSDYDSELSLLAECDGQVVGHILFSPFRFVVLGQEETGVVLAPVAVKPEYQKKGVGRMLIEEGHKRAGAKGYSFSLLCGHTEYYPKFGYKTGMFSCSGVEVENTVDEHNSLDLIERPVKAEDMPWLYKKWGKVHGNDSLALFPGKNICEWSNLSIGCRANILLEADKVLAYIRYAKGNPLHVKELLADTEDIPKILDYLANKNCSDEERKINIAMSTETMQAGLEKSNSFKVVDKSNNHKAFMIKILDEKSSIATYCSKVEKNIIKPGIIIFPAIFDVDDGRTE